MATAPFSNSGTQTLQFDGKSIRWQRKDGPYSLRYLEVRDANQERVAFLPEPYTTQGAYTAPQFEPGGSAEIDADSSSDQAVDLNNDDLYDLLRISTTITATSAGPYHLAASLTDQDGQPITGAAQAINLAVGGNAAVLAFPGGPIRQHGVLCPW